MLKQINKDVKFAPKPKKMLAAIQQYFNRYIPINDEETQFFCSYLQPKTFQRKDYLLKEGQLCHYQFFILKGLVRHFYIDQKGHELTTQFGIENWWVTNLESYLKQRPSELNIQAIEETTALLLTKKDLEYLYEKLPKLERAFRIITENMLIAIQKRNAFHWYMKSEDKYKMIHDHLPEFLQRVPQYMVASYMGMTPEHYSAVRKKR